MRTVIPRTTPSRAPASRSGARSRAASRSTSTDPFLLLDQLGPVEYEPNEAKGAPWHPHRGFETVTYVLDGEIAHHDSNGGGGLIGEGDTQWMTAGGGILHDEVPTERALARGRAVARRAAVGEPPVVAEVHAAALPGASPATTSCCCRPTTAARWCG